MTDLCRRDLLRGLAAGAIAFRDPGRTGVLQDGTRLVVIPEPGNPVAAVTAVVRVTRETVPLDEATAELVARSLFYGSTNETAATAAEAIRRSGGNLDTLRSRDIVALTAVTTPSLVAGTLRVFAEALANAEFTAEALGRSASEYAADVARAEADAYSRCERVCLQQASALAALDPVLFRLVDQRRAAQFYSSRYLPEHTVVSVAGDVDETHVRRVAEDSFQAYSRTSVRRQPTTNAEPYGRAGDPAQTVVPGKAAFAFASIQSPPAASDGYPAALVLQALLGGGHTARLYTRMRDAAAGGYDVGATFRADRAMPIVAHTEWDPSLQGGRTPQAMQELLRDVITSSVTDPPGTDELRRARRVAAGQDAIRHARTRDRAFIAAWYAALGAPPDYDSSLPGRIAAVTDRELDAVARNAVDRRAEVLGLPMP